MRRDPPHVDQAPKRLQSKEFDNFNFCLFMEYGVLKPQYHAKKIEQGRLTLEVAIMPHQEIIALVPKRSKPAKIIQPPLPPSHTKRASLLSVYISQPPSTTQPQKWVPAIGNAI